jgi:hypothetical protein
LFGRLFGLIGLGSFFGSVLGSFNTFWLLLRLGGLSLFGWLGSRGRSCRLGCIGVDVEERFSNSEVVSSLHVELGNDAGRGTFNLDCDLIGLDVGHGLVQLDPLALLLHELGDGSLIDGVGEEGKRDGFS